MLSIRLYSGPIIIGEKQQPHEETEETQSEPPLWQGGLISQCLLQIGNQILGIFNPHR